MYIYHRTLTSQNFSVKVFFINFSVRIFLLRKFFSSSFFSFLCESFFHKFLCTELYVMIGTFFNVNFYVNSTGWFGTIWALVAKFHFLGVSIPIQYSSINVCTKFSFQFDVCIRKPQLRKLIGFSITMARTRANARTCARAHTHKDTHTQHID